ncbi:tRNA (adenosine(37)-N6)-dimethylallyltransferase MiaA [Metaclostridioides mangenotii]|uniref:tRNA dimethylallyltransferase n=1 Tax=Metaclostridioides mangenotii TaxID=1540 RepID=A0ABS4E7R9_9FIRM|nr:tRNA (adenosine(37)-N6)-dimethylallyltransferase MiaA [Clostridioides mangenotii]MBP1853985.1 tRNA dimethylallyltransferase [Clostridioides mangenotii]
MNKIPIIILTGPTAVGKTDLSIELAKALDAEIISADSMQLYEYMDIGSAKVSKEEMDGVKHYMIDEVKPDYPFSVSEFQQRSKKYIEDIHKRGKKVIVTGGTGLYLNSLIYEMDFGKSKANTELRDKLQLELDEKGSDYMHDKLRDLNEDAANRIHKNNTKRVMRALEVELNGEKMNDFSKDLKFNENYYPIIVILNRDRGNLYNRINLRVDIMLQNGLIDEVKGILDMGYNKDLISMQGIGYKEILKYLDGEYTYEEAVEIIKRDSRKYAKRQITWFKRYKDAPWFDVEKLNSEELKKEILQYIEKMLYIM